MENLPRNMAQHSRVKSTARKYKTQTRWTLLLIGDLGKVASFQVTRPVLVALLVCLAVGLSIFVYSVVSYNLVRVENRELKKGVNKLTSQLENAENLKEEALVRLMLLEDRVKWAAKKDKARPADTAKDEASEVAERTGPAPAKSSSPPEAGKLAPPISTARVSVEDLQIWYEPVGNAFKFKFKVKNIDREGGKVAGYAFLVLEPREDSGETPRAFPPSPLADGKPSDFKSGHHFSIARYTFIRGTLTDVSAIRRFKSAIIYAYSDAGHLLIEKVFEVG